MNIKEKLTHPLTVVTGGLGGLGILIEPNILTAIFAALWQSAGTLFTGTSIFAFTFAEQIPALEPYKPVAVSVAIATGVFYLTKLATRVYDNFEREL